MTVEDVEPRGRDWVALVEPTRARIVRGIGANGEPLKTDLALRARQNNVHGALSDDCTPRPGGVAVKVDDESFAADLVTLLDAHRVAGDFDRVHVLGSGRMITLVTRAMRGPMAAMLGATVALGLTDGAIDLGLVQLIGLIG